MDLFPRRTFWNRVEPRLAHRADPQGIVEEVERIQGLHLPVRIASQDRVPELTPAQSVAWSAIERPPCPGQHPLLYGVTGSGKPSSICAAAAWCLRHGKSALVLVPEIALSSQVADRFASRFARVAILHSGLSDAERYAAWQGIAAGRYPVVGPRSALRPGSGRGIDRPRRRARPGLQAGLPPRTTRDRLPSTCAVDGRGADLGSATPSVETFWRSRQGDVDALPERVGPECWQPDRAKALPWSCLQVDVVDMRLELHRGNTSC